MLCRLCVFTWNWNSNLPFYKNRMSDRLCLIVVRDVLFLLELFDLFEIKLLEIHKFGVFRLSWDLLLYWLIGIKWLIRDMMWVILWMVIFGAVIVLRLGFNKFIDLKFNRRSSLFELNFLSLLSGNVTFRFHIHWWWIIKNGHGK